MDGDVKGPIDLRYSPELGNNFIGPDAGDMLNSIGMLNVGHFSAGTIEQNVFQGLIFRIDPHGRPGAVAFFDFRPKAGNPGSPAFSLIRRQIRNIAHTNSSAVLIS